MFQVPAAYVPTAEHREQVKAMTAIGIKQEDIGLVLGISEKSVRKHFPKEIKLGLILANTQVGGALFKLATQPGTSQAASAMFWAKTRMGWRETAQTVALVGADGGPLEVRHITRTIIDPAKMSAKDTKAKKG
jgi:hypothetical protein